MPGKNQDNQIKRVITQSTNSCLVLENDPNHWSSALRCTICLEYFRDPRCLPCGHTFCKACIEEIIEHVRKWQQEYSKKVLSFACPHCRRQLQEVHYNKFSSKNVVVESILEGWSASTERFKMIKTKTDYATQTEINVTDSWIQTEPIEETGTVSTQTEEKANSLIQQACARSPPFNIASQLNHLNSLIAKNSGSKHGSASQGGITNDVRVEEALYSLQDNLLPGDHFQFGEYQLVTLPEAKPSIESTNSLIQTLNKVFS